MSLSCPVLNDIILEEINEIKKIIEGLSDNSNLPLDNSTIDQLLSEKYCNQEKEIEKLQNSLELYKSDQLNNALLNEKIDNINNNISQIINKLENNITIVNEKIDEHIINYKKRDVQSNNIEKIQENKLVNKEVHSNILNLQLLENINKNINDLTKRVENLEKRKNYRNNYTRHTNYNYKDQSNNYNNSNNNMPNSNSSPNGWTKVVNKKKFKRVNY